MSKVAEIRVGAQAAYYNTLKGRRTFTFQGKAYKYLFRRYNTTYANERAVEIPIAMEVVRGHPEERVLEVGNVLAHYYPHHHDVLDKYGVANSFEVYQGTHTSAVAVRFQNYVLPFFSKNLCFVNNCK